MNRRFVNLLAVAKDKCDSDGLRLTEKRKRVLNLLIDAQAPLSAYEIKDMFTTRYSEDVKPMTIYRALEFLTETDLVHKLNLNNTSKRWWNGLKGKKSRCRKEENGSY